MHALVYFAPEVHEEASVLDHPAENGLSLYFHGRAAPLGRVSDKVVQATFYNFSPRIVREHMSNA